MENVAHMENNILVGKQDVKRPLGKAKYRWKHINKTDLKVIRCEDVSWIHVAWDRVQQWILENMIMNLWAP